MVVGLLGSFVVRARAQPATVDDIIAAFDRDCVPGQMTSAACQASREGAERLLLMQLEYLTAQGQRVDPAILREAAQARWPALQRFGLQRLAVVGPAPADAALGEAALESPYAGVRRAGLAVLQTLDGPRWHPLAVRDYGPGTGSKREPSLDMVPDVQPDAAALGAPLYPASTYSFLMSGLRRPVFVTSDPPDRVVAFYAQGRRSYTRPELEAAIRAAQQPDPADLAARAMRGEDMRKLAEEMQQAALAAPNVAAWASGIQGQSGVETPRYVPIEERPVLGKTMPVRVVVIFADRVLGKTAIVFPRDPARAANYFSRDAVLDRAFAQRLFSQPLPPVEGPDPTR
jgi:hypothetical protein